MVCRFCVWGAAESLFRVAGKPEAEIECCIVRGIGRTIRRAQMTPEIVPAAASVDAIGAGSGPRRVRCRTVSIGSVPVPAPYPDVAVHVVQAHGFGAKLPTGTVRLRYCPLG